MQISRFNIGALAELVHSRQMHIEADKGVADLEKRITEASVSLWVRKRSPMSRLHACRWTSLSASRTR